MQLAASVAEEKYLQTLSTLQSNKLSFDAEHNIMCTSTTKSQTSL